MLDVNSKRTDAYWKEVKSRRALNDAKKKAVKAEYEAKEAEEAA